MTSNKIVLIAAIVVVGAGVCYFALRNNTPAPAGTEGTIGAAKRYSEPQITEGDVSLQDPEIQSFIQSDVFHKMQTNAEFRNLVKSPEFGRLAATGELAKVVDQADFQKLAKNPDYQKLASDPDFNLLASHADFWKVTIRPSLAS